MVEEQKVREELCKRWEALGLTNGLQGEVKETIAKLFENESKDLLKETKEKLEFNEVNFPKVTKVLGDILYGSNPKPMK